MESLGNLDALLGGGFTPAEKRVWISRDSMADRARVRSPQGKTAKLQAMGSWENQTAWEAAGSRFYKLRGRKALTLRVSRVRALVLGSVPELLATPGNRSAWGSQAGG